MWPDVLRVEQHPTFQPNKDVTLAGEAVKQKQMMRKFTLDYGTIGGPRNAVITPA
jgi:hypothetical protein